MLILLINNLILRFGHNIISDVPEEILQEYTELEKFENAQFMAILRENKNKAESYSSTHFINICGIKLK